MTRQISIIQHNVNRQRIASQQLRDYSADIRADIILIQEPVISEGRVYGFEDHICVLKGDKAGSAVIILNKKLQALELSQYNDDYIIAVKVGSGGNTNAITLVSAYFKYNKPTLDFIEKLRTILEREKHTIIGADVNGHSTLWHCNSQNDRGRHVETLIEDFDLRIANTPQPISTYHREGMGESNIDVTLMTPHLQDRIRDWTVSNETDSDHNVLTYNIDKTNLEHTKTKQRYNIRRANWDIFNRCLIQHKNVINNSNIEDHAKTIIGVIETAAKKAIPKAKPVNTKAKQPWWNQALTRLKKDLDRKRRLGTNRTDRQLYNSTRNLYLAEIRRAKMETWKVFAEDINKNNWGRTFKWAKNGTKQRRLPATMKDKDGAVTNTIGETSNLLLSAFFPRADRSEGYEVVGPIEKYGGIIDNTRVKAAIWRMKPNKAPGLDGISAGMIRKAWPILGDEITALFKSCIEEAVFPQVWKKADLVVIPKPGKTDYANPKMYRPVCLLPTMAKALETIIIQELERETELNKFKEQHGFVQGRSTITAMKEIYNWSKNSKARHIFGVFLDITGAFDNMGWRPMLERMTEMGASIRTLKMVQCYLSNREVELTISGTKSTVKLERGCPQGSQLGPTLWKVAMTDIGKIKLEDSAKIVLYADDIALIVGAARPQTAFSRIETYLENLKEWASKFKLEFSGTKTQMMAIKGGVKPRYTVSSGTQQNADFITPSKCVKYLGVILDPRESYLEHIRQLKEKSAGMFNRLRRMTSANWGMNRITARIIYKAVFLPRVTYAAEIWAHGCKLKKSVKILGSIQRAPLIAITSAYRTASTNCLSAVAGVLPLDLEIRRMALKSKNKNNEISNEDYNEGVEDLLGEWQERYDASDKGEWTKFMIPDIRTRVNLPLIMDHYTTQLLTGHGDFRSKLFSLKLVGNPNCECGGGAETVRHVLLACKRTENERRALEITLRDEGEDWPPRKGAFLKSRNTYEALRRFAGKALKNRIDR